MLRPIILALALVTSTKSGAIAKEPWLVRVGGVICESEAALRNHFSLLPDRPSEDDHKKAVSAGCKWHDAGVIYAVSDINFLTHGFESILIGSLHLWPDDKPAKWGIISRQPLAWLTAA